MPRRGANDKRRPADRMQGGDRATNEVYEGTPSEERGSQRSSRPAQRRGEEHNEGESVGEEDVRELQDRAARARAARDLQQEPQAQAAAGVGDTIDGTYRGGR